MIAWGILAGYVLLAIWFVTMAARAEAGYEDKDGFHFGEKDNDDGP